MSTKHFLCYAASLLALAACGGDDDADPAEDSASSEGGSGGSLTGPSIDTSGVSGSGATSGTGSGFAGVGAAGTLATGGVGGIDTGVAGSGLAGAAGLGTGGAGGVGGTAGVGGAAGAPAAGAGGSTPVVIPTGDGVAVAQLKGQIGTTGNAPTANTPVCESGVIDNNCANPDSGTVVFTQTRSGVTVTVDIENCYNDVTYFPQGVQFPVRIHTGNSCATPATQGGEWEPGLGIPDVVCKDGRGHIEAQLGNVTVGGENDVVGHAFVLHIPEVWDDGQDRVACGVIQLSR